ncbi:MAG: GFA family protein [Burkholderiales bacterium]|nr:GFA family protein [Burkholderiales bacterium]
MILAGGCFCGNIRYELSGAPKVVAVCHCSDCRRSAGAPMVAWAMYLEDRLVVTKGTPRTIHSSAAAMRSFCPDCGTGLFYRNQTALPGIVDVQAATLDDPEALPPTIQVQTAERLEWTRRLHELQAFERFPG